MGRSHTNVKRPKRRPHTTGKQQLLDEPCVQARLPAGVWS
jgi:hypothetical protein